MGKNAYPFLASGIVAIAACVSAAPTVDLNGAASGVSYTGFYSGYDFSGGTFANNATITPDSSSTITQAEFRIVNAPDGAAESLYQLYAFPVSLTVTAYEPSSRVLLVSGNATASEYASILSSIAYKNTASDPQLMRRYVSVRVHDGTEWSAPVAGGIDMNIIPANPVITPLFEDDFNSYNASNWTVLSGPAPTVNLGKLTISGSSIETAQTFIGAPLYMEVTGAAVATMPADGSFAVGVRAYSPIPSRGASWGVSRFGGGYFYSAGSFYGNQTLEGGYADSFPPIVNNSKIANYFDHRGVMMSKDGNLENFGNAFPLAANQGNWKLFLSGGTGTDFVIEKVTIGLVQTTNPRFQMFTTADASLQDMPTVDLKAGITVPSGSVILSAALNHADPPGAVPMHIGKFWDLQSKATSTVAAFSAQMELGVTNAELNNAGLFSDVDVMVYRSNDNGNTWMEVPPVEVNRSSGYVRVVGITEFSLWTVGSASEPTAINSWELYH